MPSTRIFLLYLFFAISGVLCSQQVVVVKRDRAFAFFQKGEQRDTVSKNKGDVFYLHIPDSMKSFVVISVENGKFDVIAGDSLLRLTYLRGHKYESFFVKEEDEQTRKVTNKFITAVNGASSLPGNEVLITFYDKRSPGKSIIENKFWFAF